VAKRSEKSAMPEAGDAAAVAAVTRRSGGSEGRFRFCPASAPAQTAVPSSATSIAESSRSDGAATSYTAVACVAGSGAVTAADSLASSALAASYASLRPSPATAGWRGRRRLLLPAAARAADDALAEAARLGDGREASATRLGDAAVGGGCASAELSA